MRVLVTDGEMSKSLAVLRSVAGDGVSVGVTSRFPVSPAGVSRHADASHWVRTRDPVAYVDALDRIGRAGDYDQLIPVGGWSFEVVSDHRERLGLPVDRILPSREAMRVAVDKRATHALACRKGVPVPATVSVADVNELERARDTVGSPTVLKTGVETEPRYVRVTDSLEELRTAYREYRRGHESDPVVQEYLPGVGRGYFTLFFDGEFVGGYGHRRIREYPPEGGASACAESLQDEELRRHSVGLLSALDWNGVAMVEFKEDNDGRPRLVEVNPKFWGSLDLGVASGMNFPRALLERTAGRDRVTFEFSRRRVHWPLSGDLTHAWRRPRSAPAVLRDLLSPSTGSNLRLDDPLPHVLEASITLLRPDV
jgi:predicted ATP-grasp superfamily ATP-dependent carboligase